MAFCDLIEERAVKAKEEYGTADARVYTDYEELIKEELDAVYVLTPNNAHAPVAIAAMKAGKNVMCEKPMAKTFAEAKAMVETAKDILKFHRAKEVDERLMPISGRFPHGAYFWMRKSRAAVPSLTSVPMRWI